MKIWGIFLYAAAAWGARLTSDQKTVLLGDHNEARNAVASGLVGTQPAAVTMEPMVWDENLEAVAQGWVDAQQSLCGGLNHNPDRSTEYQALGGDSGAGENVAWGYSPESVVPNGWFSENDEYTFEELEPGECTGECSGVCGHYTQIVWADSTKLGCATSDIVCGATPNYIVCNYAPPGNYIGQCPYVAANPDVLSSASRSTSTAIKIAVVCKLLGML